MGARAARITPDEFVTPPEFRGLGAAGHPAGRVGGARIELVRSDESTRLGYCYQQVPLRLMPTFQVDAAPVALLYLINLTAGLLDGDRHLVEVTARPDTWAVVTGQSATRVHPALNGYATQQWSVAVEDHACLVVLPGPIIPFRGSRYYQRGRVALAPRARMAWGDIWLPGRYDRGALSERFQFETIVQDFEVRQGGRLIFRDRFRWDGPFAADAVDWYTGGALATASLFVAGPVSIALPETGPELRRSLFRLNSDASCLRWCGEPAAVTADLVQTSLRLAASWTLGPDSPPWLLASSGLAPNHWFSQNAPERHSPGRLV